MREFWLKIDKTFSKNAVKDMLHYVNQICNVVYIEGEWLTSDFKEMGVKVAARGGECDIHVIEPFDAEELAKIKGAGKTAAVKVNVKSARDEEEAVKAANLSADYLIIHCLDWKVIPLENLIAKTKGKSKLLAEVSSFEEAKLALETLELGVDGVILKTSDPDELAKAAYLIKRQLTQIKLVPVKIVGIKQIGTGARACLDTCDLMKEGEGLLLGCQSSCLFLVEAEVHHNPFVQPRPFRVNAGPVSLYVMCSPKKTRYLSELKAGEELMIVDRNGNARFTNIGRVKIEWRPLLLIEAEHEGKLFKTITQNAETIRLVTEKGSASVTALKPGDEVLACMLEGGRHFGALVRGERVVEL
ncbi:MAG: 3-dehydroquinate synthase II [Candidatus Bathyarchaeota archaeon]|nr:3-dehydroquinate synthase II [Candidatus Bathyarchaeota archaeon]MDW8023461.1 3-dehydroquinate synthase II [Nitrososphaerota archaeon]MDW8041095.1 3-dehydroquinate synthase II [Nitrososphaerota archaeon]